MTPILRILYDDGSHIERKKREIMTTGAKTEADHMFEKVGNRHLLDTTAHDISSFKSLTVVKIRIFGCECHGGITYGNAAAAVERPHVWQGQEGNRFIQGKSMSGAERAE